ncbi:MAG: glycosyltransferase family 1 protein [Patescibacteria group bacterium]|nr:glycosyltransferase family 1 protein [Patescibacteria group bacterium]
MIIAIDARSLENSKTGVGRYLTGLLGCWKSKKEHKFILYFKDEIPNSNLLKSDNFELKLLKNPFRFSSNFFFQHFQLPYQFKKDKIDFFFSPFYLKPLYCPVQSSVVLHDISYEVHPEWFDFKSQFILKIFSRLSARTANLIFTVSNYSKDEIMKFYNIDSGNITVAHLAPNYSFVKIDDLEKIKILKDKHGLNKFILCIGSIFNRRHIPEIIMAFEKIVKEYKDYQLLIIGKNHTYPLINIKDKIKTVNNNFGRNVIKHLDFVEEEDLLAFYSSCEVNIYLSDYEGFGLPVIEAQFFGKPVITSYNSSLIEVGGDSVEFVRENNVEYVYNSLKKIISDKDYRNRLVKLGDENVKRFNWKKCAEETLDKILNREAGANGSNNLAI